MGVHQNHLLVHPKGPLIDLAYRNERMQSIEAHTIYENDEFYYELGLHPALKHVPTWGDRGEMVGFYAIFHLDNGGYHFEVMSKNDIDAYAATYSKAYTSDYSPWRTNYESMALKTVLKRLLKTAPIKSDFRKAISMDETIKEDISVDMSEVQKCFPAFVRQKERQNRKQFSAYAV